LDELHDIATDRMDAPVRRWSGLAYALRALGRSEPPQRLIVGARLFERTKVIKHDFFAATAFYRDPTTSDQAVLKIGRTEPFLGFPLEWIGRLLLDRELHVYRRLRDLPNIPAVIATLGRTGFLHDFIPGVPLSKHRAVPDGFFDELQSLMRTLHERGIAYVDTNKPQNILHGDDGRPYLIDFQISFDLHRAVAVWPMTWIFRILARGDDYHILKHKKRFRPDQLTDAERARLSHKSWPIRLHRFLTRPYFIVRRAIMGRLKRSGHVLPEGTK
jgi:hypothetical protein